MSLQDILMPGEKILSECRPFYATSRRIIRYDERVQGAPMVEVAYHQLTAVEVIRKPSHPMMLLGTLAVISAIFLTAIGLIFITSLPALIAGVVLLVLGARGKLGYYRLHVRENSAAPAQPSTSEADLGTTIRSFMEYMGVMTPAEEARWIMDYSKARSFIATVRNIRGEIPEI